MKTATYQSASRYEESAISTKKRGWTKSAPSVVHYNGVLSWTEKALMGILLSLAKDFKNGKAGYAYASDAGLAAMMQKSTAQTQRYLRSLERAGFIARVTFFDETKGKYDRKICLAPSVLDEAGVDWRATKGYKFINVDHVKKGERAAAIAAGIAKSKKTLKGQRVKTKRYQRVKKAADKNKESRSSVVASRPMITNDGILLSSVRGKGNGDATLRTGDLKPDGFSSWVAVSTIPGQLGSVACAINQNTLPGAVSVVAVGNPKQPSRDLTRGLGQWVIYRCDTPDTFEDVMATVGEYSRREVAVVGQSSPTGFAEFRPDFGKHLYGALHCRIGDVDIASGNEDWQCRVASLLAGTKLVDAFDELVDLPSAAQQWCAEDAEVPWFVDGVFGAPVEDLPSDSGFYRKVARVAQAGFGKSFLLMEFCKDLKIKTEDRWEARHEIVAQWKKFINGSHARHLERWYGLTGMF